MKFDEKELEIMGEYNMPGLRTPGKEGDEYHAPVGGVVLVLLTLL